MTKVIFIDVDGVLTHPGSTEIDHIRVKIFNGLVASVDAHVVLSSDRRRWPTRVKELADAGLTWHGMSPDLTTAVADVEGNPTGGYVPRWHETMEYLTKVFGDECPDFVIIDDGMIAQIPGHMVWVDPKGGFGRHHVGVILDRWKK